MLSVFYGFTGFRIEKVEPAHRHATWQTERPVSRQTTDAPSRRHAAATGGVQLSLLTLTAMVVGSMVGAGVFSLPRRFATETGVYGRARSRGRSPGTGMLMLAFVFQTPGGAQARPRRRGSTPTPRPGSASTSGFFSAFGYWASACVGNVTYWVLIMSTLGAIVARPRRRRHASLALVLSSVGVWAVLPADPARRQGGRGHQPDRHRRQGHPDPRLRRSSRSSCSTRACSPTTSSGGGDIGALFDQVRGTMLVTVFVFLGVEGASVYSGTPSAARTSAGPRCSASSACSPSSRR